MLAEFNGDTMSLSVSGISMVRNLRVERKVTGNMAVAVGSVDCCSCFGSRASDCGFGFVNVTMLHTVFCWMTCLRDLINNSDRYFYPTW